ncbi:11377_t:CDS:1, partial [Gigaspora rosea]
DNYRKSLKNEMLKKINTSSNIEYKVGNFAKLFIPKEDRSNLAPKFLLVKILSIKKNGLYSVGCSFGILDRYYSKNNLEKLDYKNISELKHIPKIKLSLRTAAKQLEVKEKNLKDQKGCNCKSLCENNKCSCKKINILCTPKCHNQKPCKNIILK